MQPIPRYPSLINSSITGLAASTLASRETLHRNIADRCVCEDDEDEEDDDDEGEEDDDDAPSPSRRSESPQITALNRFASKVRDDPLLLDKLGRRVYELLEADLHYQYERNLTYRKR